MGWAKWRSASGLYCQSWGCERAAVGERDLVTHILCCCRDPSNRAEVGRVRDSMGAREGRIGWETEIAEDR